MVCLNLGGVYWASQVPRPSCEVGEPDQQSVTTVRLCQADNDNDNGNVGGPVVGSKAEVATTAASKGENDLEGSLQNCQIDCHDNNGDKGDHWRANAEHD